MCKLCKVQAKIQNYHRTITVSATRTNSQHPVAVFTCNTFNTKNYKHNIFCSNELFVQNIQDVCLKDACLQEWAGGGGSGDSNAPFLLHMLLFYIYMSSVTHMLIKHNLTAPLTRFNSRVNLSAAMRSRFDASRLLVWTRASVPEASLTDIIKK